MCGIAGIIYGDIRKEVEKEAVKQMTDVLAHRGPDGEGQFVRGNVGLGSRRLAIIDLSKEGQQPLSNEDGSVWIAFNGEIYNYQELRKELEGRYRFRTKTDTEVIIHGYEEWGVDVLNRLRGMFSFGIYDFPKQRLFAAVDHAGQKPFVYHFNKETRDFYFASELPAVLEAAGIERKIDIHALHLYFLHNYRHIPHPYTIFEGIRKLPPASYLVLDSETGELSTRRYWKPTFKKEKKTENEYLKEYRELTRECVKLVNVSDVPVGVFLSGGIDSSTIAAFSGQAGFSSYSIGLDNDDPELLRARVVAKKFHTNHKEILFDEGTFGDVEVLVQKLGEPLNLLPALHLHRLSKEARKELKVMIGGNGADEIFYGYDGSNRLAFLSWALKKPWLRPLLAFILPGHVADVNKLKGQLYRQKGQLLKGKLYAGHVAAALAGFDEGELVDGYSRECDSGAFIEKSYYSGFMSENQHATTIFTDLVGMANSLEIRAPFLDHKMVEFAARLPVRMKVHSWFAKKLNKYVMKRSMEGVLPNEILYAKKMGLGYHIKIDELIRGAWREKVERVLFSVLPKSNIFDMDFVRREFDEHLGGADKSPLLWGLTVFGIWYEQFMLSK